MGPSNISFLSFRVIFHWTMSMGERVSPPWFLLTKGTAPIRGAVTGGNDWMFYAEFLRPEEFGGVLGLGFLEDGLPGRTDTWLERITPIYFSHFHGHEWKGYNPNPILRGRSNDHHGY